MDLVYIANFGRENYAWPECLRRGTVATMNSVGAQPFWEANDKEGYIKFQITHERTASGTVVPRQLASRWFNLMSIIAETEGDLWIHREKDQLWWTYSTDKDYEVSCEMAVLSSGQEQVYICHKPCNKWSNCSMRGQRLEWNALHPKAQEFLFTESTFQNLTTDNANYAKALIAGDDLSSWHNLPNWKSKLQSAKRGAVTSFNAAQRAAFRMAGTAFDTAAQSNGQSITRTAKNKEVRFTRQALEKHLLELLDAQKNICAATGLPMQLDGACDDAEFLPSLDRIDSDGHYELGNLQIVCRFANRWKGDDKDENFKRLIYIIRNSELT